LESSRARCRAKAMNMSVAEIEGDIEDWK
jgi:hypothetical protein